jgi:hypothetical protein
VRLTLADAALEVRIDVVLDRPTTFAPPGAENPFDNERADVNGDGVQLALPPTRRRPGRRERPRRLAARARAAR